MHEHKLKFIHNVVHRVTYVRVVEVVIIAAPSIFSTAGQCMAQTIPHRVQVDDPIQQKTQPASPATNQTNMLPQRLSLLREGARLIDVHGSIHRDENTGWWKLMLSDESNDDHMRHDLTLLPCVLLSQMQRMTESIADEQVIFEITGQLYVHRRRNYFLPLHAPRLVGYAQRQTTTDIAPVSTQPITSAPATTQLQDDNKTSSGAGLAEQIMQQMDELVPLMKSTSIASPPPAPTTDAAGDSYVQEGVMIVDRRGQVVRDATGAWVYVFDADAEGLSDPPMTLMPCLLLERLENYAYRGGKHTPLLITGRAHLYGRRNYLMPTSFRVPRNRTPLTP